MRIAEKSERTTREKGEFLMKHKTRTKALSWLLSLAMALSLLPGLSLTAYADEPQKYALTFSANGRTVTPHKGPLPITFNSVKGDLPYGEGALDSIIGQLYYSPGIWYSGICAQEAPTVIGGSDAVTAGLDNNNYQYITINQFFNGTVTVTGKFTTSNDDEINYSVSITCAEYEEYPLWVNGVQVTSENKDDVLGDSDEDATTVTYTPAAGTTPAALTLNHANITKGYPNDNGESGIYYNGAAPLDIVLAEGSENIIKKIADELDPNKDFRYGGIYSADTNAAVTISGTGTLTAKGIYYGIKAEKDVTIKSGNVSAEGHVVGIGAANAVTIKGGTVTAAATVNYGEAHGIFGGKNVTIEGGVVTASATGGESNGIKAYDGDVVIRDGDITASGKARAIVGTVKNAIAGTGWTNTEGTDGEASIAVNTTGQQLTYKKVHIKVVSYGVWVGGEEVTSANLSGEGWNYTPANEFGLPARLTLNGYSYEGAGHAGNTFSGAIYAEQDLEINLDGESSNSVISAGSDAATSCAIYAGGDLYIYGYGSGSLTASGPMGIVSGGNLTIECDTSQIPSGSITVTGSSGSGIRSVNGNIEIRDGNLTVNGGTYGVSTDTDNGVGDLTIIGGTLTVNGDYGIHVNNMVFDKDRLTRSTVVTATGKSQAIYADTVTGADLMYVKAGTNKDLSSPVEDTSTWTHPEKWVKAKVFPEVYVGDTPVTRNDSSGKGWSFDPDTDTLTLNGYSYEGVGHLDAYVSGGIYARQSLNIELNGNNRVINTRNDGYSAYAINVSGKLSISGTGTLMAKGQNGIFATSEIAIESGTVNVTSTGTGWDGLCIHSFAVTINGGTVTASGNQAIDGMVKNAIAGTGWTNTEGTEGEASIAISTAGQTLDSYKKIQFLGHTHTFTSYTLNNAKDTITAECSNVDTLCTLPLVDNKHIATLTIAPKDDGTANLAGGEDFSVTDADIKYYSRGESSIWTLITGNGGKPSGEGFFKASITVGKDNNTATAEVCYGVNEVKKDTSFNKTTANGDFTVPSVATIGATVSIPTTPDAGYELASITANNLPTETEGNTGTFTMPAEAVTVTATFVGREVSVALTEAGNTGTNCKAALLTEAFAPVSENFKSKAGEKFVLRVSTDDEYDYSITFDPTSTVSTYLQEFSTEEYRSYAAYAKEHNISVPLSTDLFWVTMPGVDAANLTINVTFSKVKTFTVLYQPDTNTTAVWCKFTKTTGGTEKPFAVDMMPDAIMADQSVWTVKVTAAFAPEQVAFVTTKEALENAELTGITAREEVPTEDNHWTSVTGGKAVVIGGNAKTVMALFVTNPKALADYESLSATYNPREGSGITFKVAVCKTDNGVVTEAGSVTVPAAPTAPEGKQFAGWRVLEGEAGSKTEDLYGVNDKHTISIKENTILNVVWETATPTITLNLNGGAGIENTTFTVTYNNKLPTLATPTRDGVAFDGWVVSEDVTENGEFFAKGSAFDLDTPITADLKLTARWKHVHYYTCFQISEFGDAMAEYQSYADTHHVAVCGCMDVALKAHSFDSNGKCACGYQKPTPTATLGVSYGQWASGSYTAKVTEFSQTATKGTEVSVSAPSTWGSLKFSKWQYSTNGTTWKDLTAYTNVSFVIPYDMKVRALYVNSITKPEVNLSATTYPVNVSGYLLDSILFQMNYKLPDGYTYVDSGVRAGDNEGISYYELKERKRTAGQRAAWGAINFGTSLLSGGIGDAVIEGAVSAATLESNYYYEKRENSVLSEMSAATLGSYMYQNKPVNVEKYPPIYWDYKPNTVSYSGSINALIPVRFAQKNNQDHYIYGIAWLRYKKPDGAIETIYTPALATTLNGVGSSGTVTKSGS